METLLDKWTDKDMDVEFRISLRDTCGISAKLFSALMEGLETNPAWHERSHQRSKDYFHDGLRLTVMDEVESCTEERVATLTYPVENTPFVSSLVV